jgi:hypothetical protein
MIETVIITVSSIFGFSFGLYSLVKFTYNYSVNENRKQLIEINKIINLKIANERLNKEYDSGEVKTLIILKEQIEDFLS